MVTQQTAFIIRCVEIYRTRKKISGYEAYQKLSEFFERTKAHCRAFLHLDNQELWEQALKDI